MLSFRVADDRQMGFAWLEGNGGEGTNAFVVLARLFSQTDRPSWKATFFFPGWFTAE